MICLRSEIDTFSKSGKVKLWVDTSAPYCANFCMMNLLIVFLAFKLLKAFLGKLNFINISRTFMVSSSSPALQLEFTPKSSRIFVHNPSEIFFIKAVLSAFNNFKAGAHLSDSQLGQDLWLLVSVSTRVVQFFPHKGWTATVESESKEAFVSFEVAWTRIPMINHWTIEV